MLPIDVAESIFVVRCCPRIVVVFSWGIKRAVPIGVEIGSLPQGGRSETRFSSRWLSLLSSWLLPQLYLTPCPAQSIPGLTAMAHDSSKYGQDTSPGARAALVKALPRTVRGHLPAGKTSLLLVIDST